MDNGKITRKAVTFYIFITAVISVLITAYLYDYFYEKKIDEFVLTADIEESRNNISLARSLRKGGTEKTIQDLDTRTGEDAVIFTDYIMFAPDKLHKDIQDTLEMIQAYRLEFMIRSSDKEFQKRIDRALEQVK